MRVEDVPKEVHPPSSLTKSESSDEIAINVLEERLSVTKRVVDSGGGLRLRKIVHREAINVIEPLALETLDVKRVSIGREIDGPVSIRYEGDVTVFPVVEERLITRKQLMLVEEIHVSKISRIDRIEQQITLRREEVTIERQDPASGTWSIVDADVSKPTSD